MMLNLMLGSVFVVTTSTCNLHRVSEIILWGLGYIRCIPGVSTGKVYIWYIPGIYPKKTFWEFQMHELECKLSAVFTLTFQMG